MGNNEDFIALLHASAKKNATDKEADENQLFYRLQKIKQDSFTRFVWRLENLANLANVAENHCNEENGAELKKVLLMFIQSYKYAVAGISSTDDGGLLRLVSAETKRSTYEILGKNQAKARGLLETVGLGKKQEDDS